MSPPPGPRDFGDYELLEILGSGGMGTVWLARDKALGALWVVKLLKHAFHEDPDVLKRFRDEAEIVHLFQHENIVRLARYGTHDGSDYIVMEYLEGENLTKWLGRYPQGVPLVPALLIMRDICAGLEHAHNRGIIHRDLKPANIILTREGVVKLIDFGIARVGTGGGTRMTQAYLGTWAYMSPEQARGRSRDVSARSDLFSFGAVAYELLRGRRLFSGEVQDMERQILDGAPPDIEADVPALPSEVAALLSRCLERDPSNRPDSARVLRDAIEDALEERRVLRSRVEKLVEFVAGESSVSGEATTPVRRLSRMDPEQMKPLTPPGSPGRPPSARERLQPRDAEEPSEVTRPPSSRSRRTARTGGQRLDSGKLLLASLVVLLVVAAGWLGWQLRPKPQPPKPSPDSNASAQTDTVRPPPPPKPTRRDPHTKPESHPPTPTPVVHRSAIGVRIAVRPYATFYVDNVQSGDPEVATFTWQLDPGRIHTIRAYYKPGQEMEWVVDSTYSGRTWSRDHDFLATRDGSVLVTTRGGISSKIFVDEHETDLYTPEWLRLTPGRHTIAVMSKACPLSPPRAIFVVAGDSSAVELDAGCGSPK
jgi:serine/threonine protein kinase